MRARGGLAFLAATAWSLTAPAVADEARFSFQPASAVPGPAREPGRVFGDFKANTLLVIDINHDGAPDFVAAHSFDDEISVYLNNGGGGFASRCVVATD